MCLHPLQADIQATKLQGILSIKPKMAIRATPWHTVSIAVADPVSIHWWYLVHLTSDEVSHTGTARCWFRLGYWEFVVRWANKYGARYLGQFAQVFQLQEKITDIVIRCQTTSNAHKDYTMSAQNYAWCEVSLIFWCKDLQVPFWFKSLDIRQGYFTVWKILCSYL